MYKRQTKTQCIGQLAHRCGGIRYNGSIIKQRKITLVLDDFKCHRDEGFIADLLKRTNTTVILIPGGLTPLLEPLDCMLKDR